MGGGAASSAGGAGGGGGGGAGGWDPDEAWREEYAAAWGQSNAERAALRSEYADLRGDIRELKDDPALGKFDAAVDSIEKLHDKVQRPLEQLADGKALLDLADVLVSSAKTENRDGPTPSEFVTALLRKFGETPTPLVDSNQSFSWSSLGAAVSPLFRTATGCQTMNGPMDLVIKERSLVVRRQSGCLDSRPAEPDELAPDQDERNDTDKNIVVMFELLKHHSNVKLERLVLNRTSFAQTAENIFALSFLVKDGRVGINVVDSGDHFVVPKNAPEASMNVTNSQFVLPFDFGIWEKMKCMVKPGEELMPHRSSNCGRECKNTEARSARDGSKLGSDSEHLIEDEFAEEDLVEFTNDEAMKKNLVNWCPGDCTLKKRKRQHVARRLFSAND